MDSVPIWVLTSAIEIALLGYVLLGTLWWLTWRSRRHLRNRLTAVQQTGEAPEAVEGETAVLPSEPIPTTAMATEQIEAALAESMMEATPVSTAAIEVTPTEMGEAESEAPEDDSLRPLPDQQEATAEESEEVYADRTEPAESPPGDDVEDVTAASEAATVGLSQSMLDDLFASAAAEDTEAPDDDPAGIRQSLTALLADSAAMGQQIATLQEKNQFLRQAIATFQNNADGPGEAGAEPSETKVLLQEMETGLSGLQHTRERLQHEIQAHCRTLGLHDDELADLLESAAAPAGSDETPADEKTTGALQEEVAYLQSELAQRTADFERVQADYNGLLEEYQRIFQQE